MATNQRTFQDGINNVNGYIINVIRFVGAYQNGANSRIAAKHWGTITTPDGVVIEMGESGMTTPQIKKIIGGESRSYNRGEGNSEIKKLESLKSQLEQLGMDTAEVDAKIEAKKAEIEAERNRADNSAEIKKLEKEIKKLDKVKQQLESLGLSTEEIDSRYERIRSQIEDLL